MRTQMVEGSPKVQKAPPKIVVDVDELLQRARPISHQVKEKGLWFNLEKLWQD